jgi:hypothetical protein
MKKKRSKKMMKIMMNKKIIMGEMKNYKEN